MLAQRIRRTAAGSDAQEPGNVLPCLALSHLTEREENQLLANNLRLPVLKVHDKSVDQKVYQKGCEHKTDVVWMH